MKKVIYICDYCGKEIKGDVFTFRIAKKIDDSLDFSQDMKKWDPDICPDCLPAWIEAVAPKMEEPKKKPGRKPLDMGKVIALRNAGWSLERIASEMKVSPQTIANRLAEHTAPPEEEPDAEE